MNKTDREHKLKFIKSTLHIAQQEGTDPNNVRTALAHLNLLRKHIEQLEKNMNYTLEQPLRFITYQSPGSENDTDGYINVAQIVHVSHCDTSSKVAGPHDGCLIYTKGSDFPIEVNHTLEDIMDILLGRKKEEE